MFSKSEHVIWSWVKWGRHSFVNGFLLNLTMQNHFDGVVPSLIYPLKTECRDPVGWTTINEDGGVADEKETHHAYIRTVHSGRPVSAATFRGDKKAKDGGKCLSGRSMYKSCWFFICFVCWFSLIRTKAFSVFSEVSHCAATLWWDETIRKCQETATVWTKKEMACGWPRAHSF